MCIHMEQRGQMEKRTGKSHLFPFTDSDAKRKAWLMFAMPE